MSNVPRGARRTTMRNAVTCVVGLLLLVGCGDDARHGGICGIGDQLPAAAPARSADASGRLPFGSHRGHALRAGDRTLHPSRSNSIRTVPSRATIRRSAPMRTATSRERSSSRRHAVNRSAGSATRPASRSADARPPFGSTGRPTRHVPGSFGDLVPGQAVSVWVDGPVAESYPVQATASALAVVGCG